MYGNINLKYVSRNEFLSNSQQNESIKQSLSVINKQCAY